MNSKVSWEVNTQIRVTELSKLLQGLKVSE